CRGPPPQKIPQCGMAEFSGVPAYPPIQQVASESLQRERLQEMERDMVRDLNREKTLGGD
ncbi:hypothetical protein AAGO51_27580, partial [Klebsiella pneumoniae]